MTDPETPASNWVNESEPFPAFLRTLSGLELVAMQHEARQASDDVTLRAVLAELKRRSVEQ
jgi:hypothetical protein